MQRDSKGRFIKGNKFSNEIKKKMSNAKKGKRVSPKTEFKKGIIPWNKGKKVPQMSGEKHPMWKGGITSISKRQRESIEYKQWRLSVFERDGYMCQVCKKIGVYLEAHHIKSWANYPKLRFIVDNGITLCKECHALTDNYKGRLNKETNILL